MTTPEQRPPRTRGRVARDSLALATGSVFAGLLAYVFFALATRSLGAAAAAPVSILWSYWALAAAVLTFSVQHWIIATLARDGHESTVARSLPRIALAGAAIAVLCGLVAFGARGPLFDRRDLAFPAMVAAVTAGSLFTGVVRGALAGRGRYLASAACLVSENALRVAGAVAAAVAGADAGVFGVVLVLGSCSGLLWIRALRFERGSAQSPAPSSSLAVMSGIGGGSLAAQVVLTSGPVALALLGGSPAEVTSLFVALAVWRAPYLMAIGVAPQLTAWLADLARQGR
ncbi:MAG: hypothetical protein M3419_12515, partial [Actinomycetota bacterium]|nr:hypothetical protein [Actinomycetota bacterium]